MLLSSESVTILILADFEEQKFWLQTTFKGQSFNLVKCRSSKFFKLGFSFWIRMISFLEWQLIIKKDHCQNNTKYHSNCYTLSFQESKDLQVSLPKNEDIEDGLSETSVVQPQNAQKRTMNLGRMFLIFVALHFIYLEITNWFLEFYLTSNYWKRPQYCMDSYCWEEFLDSLKTYGFIQIMPFMAYLALIYVLKVSIPNKVQRYSFDFCHFQNQLLWYFSYSRLVWQSWVQFSLSWIWFLKLTSGWFWEE